MGNYIGIEATQQRDTQNRVSYTATDGQTTFAAIYSVGYIDVYQNGNKLTVGIDVTANNGTSFILATPAVLGDAVEYVAIKASNPYDVYTKPQADQKMGFYGVATGTGDAMTAAFTPVPTALVDGAEFKVRVPAANTGTTPALTIQGLGVSKTIYKYGGQAIQPGEWGANQEITLRYVTTGDRFELVSNGMGINFATLTDAATINWNISLGVMATVTLNVAGATRIFANPTNLKPGTYILFVKQDSSGNRTFSSWGSVFKWSGGTIPTLSTAANSVDIFSFVCDGTTLFGVMNKGFV